MTEKKKTLRPVARKPKTLARKKDKPRGESAPSKEPVPPPPPPPDPPRGDRRR